jgi:O-acetyl-ADP-ribose deacetylase (regulator of RNase III)
LATGNDLETYRQRQGWIVPTVDTGVTPINALGGAHDEVDPSREDQSLATAVKNGHRRIAYCECGAQLAGDSEDQLFEAAQRHLAHHHPQLLGALGQDLVQQMAEDVGG